MYSYVWPPVYCIQIWRVCIQILFTAYIKAPYCFFTTYNYVQQHDNISLYIGLPVLCFLGDMTKPNQNRFWYVVFNSHIFNAAEKPNQNQFCYVVFNSHIFQRCWGSTMKMFFFHITFIFFMRPIHVWRSRTPAGFLYARTFLVLLQQ
jgi:hypothetical protein